MKLSIGKGGDEEQSYEGEAYVRIVRPNCKQKEGCVWLHDEKMRYSIEKS